MRGYGNETAVHRSCSDRLGYNDFIAFHHSTLCKRSIGLKYYASSVYVGYLSPLF